MRIKKVLLYGHGGSFNHGGEAIVRSTVRLVREVLPDVKVILSTHFKEQDMQFKLPVDEIIERRNDFKLLENQAQLAGQNDALIYEDALAEIDNSTLCLSVGGDNYCYDNWHRQTVFHNTALARHAKSVLWGCSIEPALLGNRYLHQIFSSHDAILARESLTYNALVENKVDSQIYLVPDPAFGLDIEVVELPERFERKNTLAINVSPLVSRLADNQSEFITIIRSFIEWVIKNTDMAVSLVPHVVISVDNDYAILNEIYQGLTDTSRVSLITNEYSASQYKYILSQCRYSICSRTHATIASYSTGVPCLAIAYSVKAKGLAQDLGLNNFVVDLRSLSLETLVEKFMAMMVDEQRLIHQLAEQMKKYSNTMTTYKDVLKSFD